MTDQEHYHNMQKDYIQSSAPEAWDIQGAGSADGASGGSSSAGSAVNTQDTSQNFAGFTDIGSGFEGGNVLFRNSGFLRFGQGANSVILDANDALYRIVVGSETYATAPFRVQKDGKFHAGSSTQYIDWDGTKLTIAGDVVQIDTSTGAVKGSLQNVISLTAGETISGATTPQVVRLSDGNPKVKTLLATPLWYDVNRNEVYGVNWVSQTFTTGNASPTLVGGSLILFKEGSPTSDLVIELKAVDGGGKPTGAALATSSIAYANVAGGISQHYDFTFSVAYTCSASTQYALVFSNTSGNSTNNIHVGRSSSSILTGGENFTSADSGATWSSSSRDTLFSLRGYYTETSSRAYKAYADDITALDFIGLAITTATAGNSLTVQTSGVVSGFTGLTANTDYYLQDDGTIGTTPGSYKIKIGIANSTTTLVLTDRNQSINNLAAEKHNNLIYSEPIGSASSTAASLALTKLACWDIQASYTTTFNNNIFEYSANNASGADDFLLNVKPPIDNNVDANARKYFIIDDYFEMGAELYINPDGITADSMYFFLGWFSTPPSTSFTDIIFMKHCGFILKATYSAGWSVTTYASVSDGHTQNKTSVSGVSLGTSAKFKVIYDGRSAKFYIDDVLKATLTSNLPAGSCGFTASVTSSGYGPLLAGKYDGGSDQMKLIGSQVYSYYRIANPIYENFANNFLTH